MVSSPEHLREWWPDDADLEPVAGATGTVSFGDTNRRAHRRRGRPAPAVLVPLGLRGRGRYRGQLAAGDLRPDPVRRWHAAAVRPRPGSARGREAAVLESSTTTTSAAGTTSCPASRAYVDRLVRAMSRRSTTTSGRRSATRPGAGCSTCCSPAAAGPRPALSEQLPVTRQAVAKHLAVLDRVGLVHATPAGRETPLRGRRSAARPRRRAAGVASAPPGTPGCAGSSGSPRRSSAAQQHATATITKKKKEVSTW